ncbi:hypothetical protein PHLCEN_2v3121 [Hermanssonia centrifuga]|uniref:Uncharacterized protein n=1 Tax=Hermanssonia centrifuga TaxID=98765 RepID=A0A2R6R404_9APHY|nr:hypothetical protein PHLCEN_2v3121 [Hermanssonia centrifuga]
MGDSPSTASQPQKRSKARTIEQHFLNMRYPRLEVQTVMETDLTSDSLNAILFGNSKSDAPSSIPRAVGLAPGYTSAGKLTVIAVAVKARVLLIQFRSEVKKGTDVVVAARQLLHDELLCHDGNALFAFDMGPLAMALYLDHGLYVRNAIDVQSACTCKGNRDPANAVEFAIGTTSYKVYRANVTDAFSSSLWDPSKPPSTTSVALKAWLAAWLPEVADMEERLREVQPIDTKGMSELKLKPIAQFARSDYQLASKKSIATSHEFTSVGTSDNKHTFRSTRFQNHFRNTNNAVRMTVVDAIGAQYNVQGRASEADGRRGVVKAEGVIMEGKAVVSVTTIGQDGPTLAEQQKAATILRMLQDQSELLDNPFLRTIWPDGKEVVWPTLSASLSTEAPSLACSQPLNHSQRGAVEQMLSSTDASRITMVQGPPGTGKTTVIAAFVQSAVEAGKRGIWLMAQSNVAVKNIAEKLAKVQFENWRLLVSKDFHMDWHEHLYGQISTKVIRSDEFRSPTALQEMQDCQVVLCTLSMLAHPHLARFTFKVPIKTVVIDEASQIAVADYIAPLQSFPTIEKLCFIGDDKQLPPYGQEDIEELLSIFEIPHLRLEALFLDTQYRMPPQLGEFISDAVYDGQLSSNPDHPITGLACFFVDVNGATEKRNGTSWENPLERAAVLQIAARFQEDSESFRIITPYDAQRSTIENDLKAAGLSWENKCFNVDSFQGNEDDYIIISLVRSDGLGFLEDLRRTNVMLTRCKKGMFICTSWDFLVDGKGANSLVGRLAASCGDDAWLSMEDLAEGNF